MSLLSYTDYQTLSGDTTSASSSMETALANAVSLLEDASVLNRILEFGTYTEDLKVTPHGFAYPAALPLDSVPASATYAVYDTSALHLVVPGFVDPVVAWDLPFLDRSWEEPSRYPRATVTYTGGWTAATLPFTLKIALTQITKAFLNGMVFVTPTKSGGTKSVGDVSVTNPIDDASTASLVDAFVPGLWRMIKSYRRRVP